MLVEIPLPRPGDKQKKAPTINPIPGIYRFEPAGLFPRISFDTGAVRFVYLGTEGNHAVYRVEARKGKMSAEDFGALTEFLLALSDPKAKAFRQLSSATIFIAAGIVTTLMVLIIRGITRR